MAFARVQGATAGNAGSAGDTVITVALTGVAAGSLKCIAVIWYLDVTVTTVRDTGNNDFTAASSRLFNGNEYIQLWYLVGGSTGSVTYTATFSSSAQYRDIYVDEFTHSNGTFDVIPSGGGSTGTGGTASSGTFTTTGAAELVYAAVSTDGNLVPATWLVNGAAADGHAELTYTSAWYRSVSGTFTGDATVGIASQAYACVAMAFKESTGAAGLSLSLAEPVIGSSVF